MNFEKSKENKVNQTQLLHQGLQKSHAFFQS